MHNAQIVPLTLIVILQILYLMFLVIPACFFFLHVRAGDRIFLADDSNEDWWKVGTKPA